MEGTGWEDKRDKGRRKCDEGLGQETHDSRFNFNGIFPLIQL
jgi:hypothetical protein